MGEGTVADALTTKVVCDVIRPPLAATRYGAAKPGTGDRGAEVQAANNKQPEAVIRFGQKIRFDDIRAFRE